MISLKKLAIALKIDKTNLSKVVKRLGIKATKMRGERNQWAYYFTDENIDMILKYREGLTHDLIKTETGYCLKEKNNA